jgi:hypothetical protein
MALAALVKDRIKLGLVIGILLPLAAVYVQYLMKYTGWAFPEFINVMKRETKLLTGVSTLALVANGLLFGILINFKRFETARGICIPTVIFGVAVLLWKLLH